MKTSLIALAALPLLASACASTGTPDELAGETTEDEALDGKADGAAPDGVYTYFEVWTDMRKCVSPMCGGFFLHRLNRTSTTCHDGSSDWNCYVPELDFAQSNLSEELQGKLLEAANRDALSEGAIALVRGRFGTKQFDGFGNMGRFIVTEAWVSDTDDVSDGVFVKAKDSGVRCITTPCPSTLEKALNTSRSANLSSIDWTAGTYTDEQIAAFGLDMYKPGGVIFAGDRFTFTEHGTKGKGRTATAVYRQLVDAECHVGGCSGQLCTEDEGMVSTCEWKEEYACYQTATCERQTDGTCGWTETPELTSCLAQN